jgi:mono/diheme cytochrome c family protein
MPASRAPAALLFVAWSVAPTFATAAQPDLPGRVRAVFSARCAACHGPDLRKPKGKFGYITDLPRLAESPKLVVPAKPEESRLWELVENGEMPPEDARTGALSPSEKDVIRDWIAAGAPVADPSPAEAVPSSPPPSPAAGLPPAPFSRRLLGWLGKFHVTVIHFPIALLLTAAAVEAWCLLRRRREPWPPVRFYVLFGAAGAVVAAGLGWLLADASGFGIGSPQLLALHRWLGTGAAAWSVGVALLSEWDVYRRRRGWPFRLALWAGAALIGSAAHFGGILVHGEDFFAW